MGEVRDACRIVTGKLEVERPLGRSRHRWEDNNEMNLKEIVCKDVDWIYLPQDRALW
jgi:hypothetical protein